MMSHVTGASDDVRQVPAVVPILPGGTYHRGDDVAGRAVPQRHFGHHRRVFARAVQDHHVSPRGQIRIGGHEADRVCNVRCVA